MENITDKILGILIYQDAWIKEEPLEYNGINLAVIFQAFSDELVTEKQKELYLKVIENLSNIVKKTCVALAESLGNKADTIFVEALYFNRFDEFGFLAEYEDDEEHGFAIKFDKEMNILETGSQDILF